MSSFNKVLCILSENNQSQPASFNNNRYEVDRFVAPFDSHPVQMNGEADYDNDEYDREERMAIAGDRLAEIRQVLGCLPMQAAEHHDAEFVHDSLRYIEPM